jgi:hypothetical protein
MDKILNRQIFISFIFIINFSFASTLTIDEQIAIIKQAPESKRVELMNQFKRQLILMNRDGRESAIARLKNNTQSTVLPPQSNDVINNLQQSSIEQHTQMARDTIVEQEVNEHVDIPMDSANPVTQQPDIPVDTPNPTTQQPDMPVDTPNPTTQQPDMPVNTPNPTTGQSELPVDTTNPIDDGQTMLEEPSQPLPESNRRDFR